MVYRGRIRGLGLWGLAFLLLAGSAQAGPKWGFIEAQGKEVVPAIYDGADGFADGMAKVRSGREWGYVDRQGELVIPAHFFMAGRFAGGVVAAKKFGDKGYRLIDQSGRAVSERLFDESLLFQNGLAVFGQGGKRGVVDTRGQVVIEPRFGFVSGFSHPQRASVTLDKGYGFIDRSGALVIPGPFQEADPFDPESGLARVKVKGKTALMDTQGKFLFPPKYRHMGQLVSGRISVRVGRKAGYVDAKGKLVIKPIYEFAETFIGGLARVKHKGKWGLIDSSGRVVVPIVYDSLDAYNGVYTKAQKGGQVSFLKGDGSPFTQQLVTWLGKPSEGKVSFRGPDGKAGYLDLQGQVVIPAQWCFTGPFSEGLAPVQHCP